MLFSNVSMNWYFCGIFIGYFSMNINSRYFIISCFALIMATPLIGQPTFIDRGIEFGLVESYSDLPLFGGGLSVRDFDGDGWDDVTMCTGAGRPIKFYKNQFGQGFQEVSPIPTPSESQFFSCWIDFDGDNDLDFFIVTLNNGVRLYSNDGNMNYSDITNISGLSKNIVSASTNINESYFFKGKYFRANHFNEVK